MAYENTCSGMAAIGWSRCICQNWFPSTVNRRGAVSPTMRAIARRIPVTIPAEATRTTM